MPHLLRRTRRLSVGLIAAAGLALLTAAPRADAGILVESAERCPDETFEQPFTPWLDGFHYVLAPGGTFEGPAEGWTRDGARTVAGNESYYVHDAGETTSLAIPLGGSATSPVACVGLSHPTLRFFARNSGSPLSVLAVEVLFEDSLGQLVPLPIGVVPSTARWRPTLPMPIVANLLPLLPGERTPVAFRFRPLLGGSWQIDDVYIDPYRAH
jgi:hypothetical protein